MARARPRRCACCLLGFIEPEKGLPPLLGNDRPREVSDHVGYLPEERGLYPSMKTTQAIAFMGALRGLDWRTGRTRAVALMEAAGLGHATDQKIRKLSKRDGPARPAARLGRPPARPAGARRAVFRSRSGQSGTARETDPGRTRSGGDDPLFHPCHGACRAAVRSPRDHRGGKVRFEGTVADARATLPFKAHYVPHHPNDGIPRAASHRCLARGGWMALHFARRGNRGHFGEADRCRLRHIRPVDRAAQPARRFCPHRRRESARGSRGTGSGGAGMSSLARLIRQTLTIARRDFVATVFTPTFLLSCSRR
ncbi:putative ABC transporter ATP-binding protein YhaQ [Ditylenchus destructor]|uniref:ABC transporter ATP-binding protein YhaQ n=1 Tax=Ditylenchus destructor TaxID=166010 RepID=A0AAD4MH78_9BILA|nr:putative ABC transporter ATP-binding protein YhaQ [Ditylenchus destructor]